MRTEGIDQTQQKENNLSIILRRLMTGQDCTRVKLAAQTGLAQATVTKIISQLMDAGIVSEEESIGAGVGRRAVRLRLLGEQFVVAAVRINRDTICGTLVDMNRRTGTCAQCSISFEEGTSDSVRKLKALLHTLMDASKVPVCAIGVAVPGPFSCHTGRISLMSGFPGWDQIDLRAALEEDFPVPVFLEHDANCGAMAESWDRDMDSRENLLFVAADMGIGAGMILDSRLYRGKDGFAGEIGHASICYDGPLCECGNRGCLELYASTRAMEYRYFQHSGIRLDTARILELVRMQDPDASAAYIQTIQALACGLVNITNIVNPDAVVFSGRLSEGGPLFLSTIKDVLHRRLMPEQIRNMTLRISRQPIDPMLLGAAVIAFDNMLQTPSTYFFTNKAIKKHTGGT